MITDCFNKTLSTQHLTPTKYSKSRRFIGKYLVSLNDVKSVCNNPEWQIKLNLNLGKSHN